MLTLAKLQRVLSVALASRDAGEQVAAAVNPLPNIAQIGAQTAVRSDTLANCAADANARFANLEAKYNTLLTALETGGKMNAS